MPNSLKERFREFMKALKRQPESAQLNLQEKQKSLEMSSLPGPKVTNLFTSSFEAQLPN